MQQRIFQKDPMILFNKDQLVRHGRGLVLRFQNSRKVLHTSVAGGGIRRDLEAIFNFDLKDENGRCELREKTYKKELERIAVELGLDPRFSVGMTTAVTMDDVVVEQQESHGLSVAAVVTGGIERNGGYPGDRASYREENDSFLMLGGTINTMVIIGADLPDGILCRAAVTATEAKAAAIHELRLPSAVSPEIATGSGTDGLAVVSDPASPLKRTDAGKHSLLGQLIGGVVRSATKKALLLHMESNDTDMTRMSNRLKRFGVCKESFFRFMEKNDKLERSEMIWAQAEAMPELAVKASMVAAIMDDMRHGIFSEVYGMNQLKRQLFPDGKENTFPNLWYEFLMRIGDIAE